MFVRQGNAGQAVTDRERIVWVLTLEKGKAMIKKLYIDNFRCLGNFELDLNSNQLWLGDNGTGKSSVLLTSNTLSF